MGSKLITKNKPIVKIYEFEVYTKNKETMECGWEIAFPLIEAESRSEALKKLNSFPFFDCIICSNFEIEKEYFTKYYSDRPTALNKKAVILLGIK